MFHCKIVWHSTGSKITNKTSSKTAKLYMAFRSWIKCRIPISYQNFECQKNQVRSRSTELNTTLESYLAPTSQLSSPPLSMWKRIWEKEKNQIGNLQLKLKDFLNKYDGTEEKNQKRLNTKNKSSIWQIHGERELQ